MEVRLAHVGAPEAMALGLAPSGSGKPGLLVSFYFLKDFQKNRHRYAFRDWVMDSGAYSAHNSGAQIDLQEYIDTCRRLLAEDPMLTEVYALDVIHDPQASLRAPKNT